MIYMVAADVLRALGWEVVINEKENYWNIVLTNTNSSEDMPESHKSCLRGLLRGWLMEFNYEGGRQQVNIYKELHGLDPEDDRYSCLDTCVKRTDSNIPVYKLDDREIFVRRKDRFDRYVLAVPMPETKQESEDERTRKVIYGWIYTQPSQFFDGGFSKEEMLAWLEQGEKKPANKVGQVNNKLVPKFSVGQRIRHRSGEMPAFVIDRIEDDHYRGKNNESVSIVFQDDWELVEQKPAEWSEEDDQYLLVCKNALRKYQVTDKWDSNIISQWLDNKLKSLKDRVQPKQEWSEEDSYMLGQAIKCVNNSGKLDVSTEEIEDWLKSLKERALFPARRALIEEVCEWLDDHLDCYIVAQDFTIEYARLNNDLVEYIEEES